MKILYKPIAILAGVLSAKLGRSAFKALWAMIDSAEPPASTTRDADLGRVVLAATLEAATLAATRAIAERASARYFHFVTGLWPGEEPSQPSGR